jgi:hypothetical protein
MFKITLTYAPILNMLTYALQGAVRDEYEAMMECLEGGRI